MTRPPGQVGKAYRNTAILVVVGLVVIGFAVWVL